MHQEQLSEQKIEADLNGTPLDENYVELLLNYLIENELLHAKFLWKRIPAELKQNGRLGVELAHLWSVTTMLLKKDYVKCYAAMKCDWSEIARPLIARLREILQGRMTQLVAKSYSSIPLEVFARLIDLTPEEAARVTAGKGWVFESSTKMLLPKADPPANFSQVDTQKQLHLLSGYVSFLEN